MQRSEPITKGVQTAWMHVPLDEYRALQDEHKALLAAARRAYGVFRMTNREDYAAIGVMLADAIDTVDRRLRGAS